MKRRRPSVGSAIQVALPNGMYAYGRVLRDASVAFYRALTSIPMKPPIGSRDFLFTVGVHDDVLTSDRCVVVGHDPSTNIDDDWPPPYAVKDAITGQCKIYRMGALRPATETECQDLEPAAVWDYVHLSERLLAGLARGQRAN